ncbi:MAG: TIGR00725 family protein [Acidobacteriota bacterium]|nr:TIGR00725 family protein [Acidobacteriota bacterium]
MTSSPAALQISVIGAGVADEPLLQKAEAVGRLLAEAGAVVVCGGRGGVMEAACRGAQGTGGVTLGVLPGSGPDDSPPNAHVTHAIYTGLGQGRNQVVVLSGSAAIAIGGAWGTLNEIALALKHGRTVVCLGSWQLERPDGLPEPRLLRAEAPEEAVQLALDAGLKA